MEIVINRQTAKDTLSERPLLFAVWVDVNCGLYPYTDWEMNTHPKELHAALDESFECQQRGFPTKIMLEGKTPRPDGLFTNPLYGD